MTRFRGGAGVASRRRWCRQQAAHRRLDAAEVPSDASDRPALPVQFVDALPASVPCLTLLRLLLLCGTQRRQIRWRLLRDEGGARCFGRLLWRLLSTCGFLPHRLSHRAILSSWLPAERYRSHVFIGRFLG